MGWLHSRFWHCLLDLAREPPSCPNICVPVFSLETAMPSLQGLVEPGTRQSVPAGLVQEGRVTVLGPQEKRCPEVPCGRWLN